MHTGLEKKYIQGHLLAFSAASPIVAIASYFILKAVRKHTRHLISVRNQNNSMSIIWVGCVCVHSPAVQLRTSSVQQVWECSSLPGPFSTWLQCMFFQKSAAAGQVNPHPTPTSPLEPRCTSSSATWGSWRASHSSLGSGSRWCWLLGCTTTEKGATGQLGFVQTT